ncbi:MAG: hypothetical protein WDZ77_00870 [Candidatus Pacearchaeota archaeon]
MSVEDLKKTEKVELYSVLESQRVIEDDSPAIGTTTIILQRDFQHNFFHSREKSLDYINSLVSDSIKKDPKLELVNKARFNEYGLLEHWWDIPHIFSGYFQIQYSVLSEELNIQNLPENIETLLKSPERILVRSENHQTFSPDQLIQMGLPSNYDFEKLESVLI